MSTQESWEKYAKKFNALSNKMVEVGIDLELLREVIEASNELHNAKNDK